jgi:hypothetical protein
MNTKNRPGRKSEVENREQYGKNLFHWSKVRNIFETDVIEFCIVIIKFGKQKTPEKIRSFIIYCRF